MRTDWPAEREIINKICHYRVGIAVPAKQSIRSAAAKYVKARQAVVPVTVFFFDPDWAPLDTGAAAGVKPAIVARAPLETIEEGACVIDDTRIVYSERRRRDRCPLVVEVGPAALRSDVIGDRIGPPKPSKLRIRLGTAKRHGKRHASA